MSSQDLTAHIHFETTKWVLGMIFALGMAMVGAWIQYSQRVSVVETRVDMQEERQGEILKKLDGIQTTIGSLSVAVAVSTQEKKVR